MNKSQKHFKIKIGGINDSGIGYAKVIKDEKQYYNLMIPYVLPNEEVTVTIDNNNNENPLCDHHIKKESQKLNSEFIRNKVPYQRIILP